MPLKLMHLRPTSRINSAAWTSFSCWDAMAWRMGSESGELRVNVAAAWDLLDDASYFYKLNGL